MADNVPLNIGAGGVTLKTDELADTTHVQYIKILDPTADSSTIVGVPGNGVHGNAMRVTIASDCNWSIQAGSASIGTVGLNTGTNSVGTFGLNAGTNLIGTIEGDVAHDAVGTGIQPFLFGSVAFAQDGTAPGTAVAEGDLSRSKSDLDGMLMTTATHPYNFSASVDYGAAAQTNAIIKAATAAVSIHITDITISNGPTAVNNVTLLDGSGGTVMYEVYLAINSNVTISLRNPLRLTSNTLLAVTSTGTTELAVNVSGYLAA